MDVFKEIKNRDAWSVIRGFVYQVDTTILRWLSLVDNELLELEKGEDIDIITRDIESNELTRELEQVKYRDTKITLNNDLSIELLFNFFLHRNNNPEHKLYFKFVTNTNYGIERPALFIDGRGCIEVWIELFNSIKIDKNDQRFLTIKTQLLKKIKEKIIDDSIVKREEKNKNDEWKLFYAHIENDNNLIQIILDFEWSFGNEDHINLSKTIKSKLIELGILSDFNSANIIYTRLFLFVFKLLSSKSQKTLDKKELQKQIVISGLSPSDERLLNLIDTLLNGLDNKINYLEEKISFNSTQISQLIDDVNLINNADTIFDLRLKSISVTPPSLIKGGSQRKEKVIEVNNIFLKYGWIHFQGINGTGKTQLAALICHKFKNFWWLDLRSYNQDIEKTTLLIQAFLSKISNCPISEDLEIWIKSVLNSLPKNALIILNDLPRLDKNSFLSEMLISLGNNITNTGNRLLTTSNYKILSDLKSFLNEQVFYEYYDFNLSDKEILEMLVNNGATESDPNFINLISAFSQRNPRLVNTIIQRLKTINWGSNSEDIIEVLLKNEFNAELLEDAQLMISKYIPKVNSRELLYRLSLIHWSFRNNEILAVSNVEERIKHPNEKLQDLLYTWIQVNENLYQVSPIIKDIGINNLSQKTIQNIYLAVARSLLSSKKVDQIEASRIITSFIKGKDYNNAGLVLLNLFLSVKLKEEITILDSWGYLDYWKDIDIPKEMNIILRSFIRKEQIRLSQILNKDFSVFESRLEEYVKEESTSNADLFIIHFIILINFNVIKLSKFWDHLNYVFTNWEKVDTPFKETIDLKMYSTILWSPIQNLSNEHDIVTWLNKIEFLKSKYGINIFNEEIAQVAVAIICENIANVESQQKQVSWDIIVSNLKILITYFRKHNLEILEIVVLKQIISLEFKVFKNQKKALELTKSSLSKVKLNESKFLLNENIGKLYFDSEQKEKSRDWILNAINYDCIHQSTYIDTLLLGASIISNKNSNLAVQYCKKAVSIANNDKNYLELNYIQLLGELAIAYWINKDYINSLENFEDFISRLFKTKEENFGQNWIRLLLWCGHSLGYISAEVAKDRVPQFISSGEEYFKPYQGIFTLNNKDLSDYYNPNNEPIIFAHLAIFSDGINNIAKAYEWSVKAFDLARKNGDQKIFLLISSVCSQYSIINFKIEEAFESFLLFSAITGHLEGTPNEKMGIMGKVKISDLLTSKPNEKWDKAEDASVEFVIIPVFIMILTSYLVNSESNLDYVEKFKKMLSDYSLIASNKLLWELVSELTSRILSGSISEKELINRSNTFGEQQRKNLQIICILGIIYLSKNGETKLTQIINIIPYLTKIYKVANSLIKFSLIPFVKVNCIIILEEDFIGTKIEYENLLHKIISVDMLTKNAIQKMLLIVVNEFEIEILENRKAWLYEFKEIE
ncbi:hypothetical protein [Mariniphaga sp.]|uniref:hypothetical protein n=1 Tax=Mariniphaga sp. TaxID=1954475 RepID=UPI00356289F3